MLKYSKHPSPYKQRKAAKSGKPPAQILKELGFENKASVQRAVSREVLSAAISVRELNW